MTAPTPAPPPAAPVTPAPTVAPPTTVAKRTRAVVAKLPFWPTLLTGALAVAAIVLVLASTVGWAWTAIIVGALIMLPALAIWTVLSLMRRRRGSTGRRTGSSVRSRIPARLGGTRGRETPGGSSPRGAGSAAAGGGSGRTPGRLARMMPTARGRAARAAGSSGGGGAASPGGGEGGGGSAKRKRFGRRAGSSGGRLHSTSPHGLPARSTGTPSPAKPAVKGAPAKPGTSPASAGKPGSTPPTTGRKPSPGPTGVPKPKAALAPTATGKPGAGQGSTTPAGPNPSAGQSTTTGPKHAAPTARTQQPKGSTTMGNHNATDSGGGLFNSDMGLHKLGQVLKVLPGVGEGYLDSLSALGAHVENEQPASQALKDKAAAVAAKARELKSLVADLHPTYKTHHEADQERLDNPRGGSVATESKADVSRGAREV